MKTCQQKTLKNTIHCSGIGLHSGACVSLSLHPAKPDSGITFRRIDNIGNGAYIPARWDQVTDTHLRTTVSNQDGIKVSTIEHLMATFAGCELDNVLVEIDADEIPIMDGSAAPFQFLIECVGLKEQKACRQAIRIDKEVVVKERDRLAGFRPSKETIIHCEIDFRAGAISRQHYRFRLHTDSFKAELSRARTFGQLHEVKKLREIGLAQGGSFANAIVVNDEKVLNEEGLRFSDEFVRHKTLDALGDLYLAGHPFIGEFYSYRSGHELNHRALCSLLARRDAWSLVPIPVAESQISPNTVPVVTPSVGAQNDLPLTATA